MMKQFLQNLISSDETQVSTLHVCLVGIILASTIPLLAMTFLAIRSPEPFANTSAAMGTFMKDFGIGLGAVAAGVSSIWFARK